MEITIQGGRPSIANMLLQGECHCENDERLRHWRQGYYKATGHLPYIYPCKVVRCRACSRPIWLPKSQKIHPKGVPCSKECAAGRMRA